MLDRVGGAGVAVTADVADRQATIGAIAEVEAALGPIDVLVANAGIGAYGPLVDMSYEELERVVQVNVLGTMYAIKAVLPGMVARRRGHVVTIGSIAGRIGSPFEAVYSATKFAGVGLTEAFAVEVAPYGVAVSLVNPGVVATEFGDARGHPYDRDRPKPISAETVAAAVIRAIEGGSAETYVPRWFRPAVVTRHLAPPMFRWGTARSFRAELRADEAKRGCSAYSGRLPTASSSIASRVLARNDAIWSRCVGLPGEYEPAPVPPAIPRNAALSIDASWALPSSSSKASFPANSSWPSSRSSERTRKLAIWSRVTGSDGPNVPSDRPRAIPAAATALMFASWTLPSSSSKASGPGGSGWSAASKTLAMKLAICPRVVGMDGTNVVALMPRAISHQATQSMFDSWTFDGGTSVKPSSGTSVGHARTGWRTVTGGGEPPQSRTRSMFVCSGGTGSSGLSTNGVSGSPGAVAALAVGPERRSGRR